MNLIHLAAPLCSCLAVTSVLSAQQQRGVFAAVPFGVIFEDRSTTPSPSSILHVLDGGLNAELSPFTVAADSEVPDFRVSAIEAYIEDRILSEQLQVVNVDLRLDAMATGNDRMPITWVQDPHYPDGGHFQFLPQWSQQWATVFLSVQSGSTGSLPWIAGAPANLGAGSEIPGFYVEETQLPAPLPGNTWLERSIADVAIGQIPTWAGAQPDIRAMDVFIPAIVARNGVPDLDVMPETKRFYFSLTAASAAQNQAAWQILFPNESITGATIFSLRWTDQVTGQWGWSELEILADADDLDLQLGDDVDALGVGIITGGQASNIEGSAIIFSHRRASIDSRPQIRVSAMVRLQPHPAPAERKVGPLLRFPSGTIPLAAGITSEVEVDGICVGDPERGTANHVFGTPFTPQGWPHQAHLSFSMNRLPGGSVRCVISGWGGLPPVKCPVAVRYQLGSGPLSLLSVGTRGPQDDAFEFVVPAPGGPIGELHAVVEQASGPRVLRSYWLKMKL